MLLLNTLAILGRLYNTQTGEEITNPDETTKKDNEAIRKAVATQLSMSDAVQTGDLLRFYAKWFETIDF